jgi:hypothetical protein
MRNTSTVSAVISEKTRELLREVERKLSDSSLYERVKDLRLLVDRAIEEMKG